MQMFNCPSVDLTIAISASEATALRRYTNQIIIIIIIISSSSKIFNEVLP